jgi:hypothetical protein
LVPGWQITHIAIGILGAAVMTVLVLILRSSIGRSEHRALGAEVRPSVNLNISPNPLTAILSLASFSCCVAMAMPQCILLLIVAISATAWQVGPKCCRSC